MKVVHTHHSNLKSSKHLFLLFIPALIYILALVTLAYIYSNKEKSHVAITNTEVNILGKDDSVDIR